MTQILTPPDFLDSPQTPLVSPEHEEQWERTFEFQSERFSSGWYSEERHNDMIKKVQEKAGFEINVKPWHEVTGIQNCRGFYEVCGVHGLNPDEFLKFIGGKIVLDIAGGESRLHEEVAGLGVETNIVNLDLPFSIFNPVFRKDHKNQQAIAASAHEMPVATESVDLAISTYGAPTNLYSADIVEGYFNELLRVLKVGGVAMMSGVTNINAYGDVYSGESYVRAINMIRSMSSMPQIDIFSSGSTGALRIYKKDSL